MGNNVRRITKQKLGKYQLETTYQNGVLYFYNNGKKLSGQEVEEVKLKYFIDKYLIKLGEEFKYCYPSVTNMKSNFNNTRYLKSSLFYLNKDNEAELNKYMKIETYDELDLKDEFYEKYIIRIKKVEEDKVGETIDELIESYIDSGEDDNVAQRIKEKYEDNEIVIKLRNESYYYYRRVYVEEYRLLKNRLDFLRLYEKLLQELFTYKKKGDKKSRINRNEITFDDIDIVKFFELKGRKFDIEKVLKGINSFDYLSLYSQSFFEGKSTKDIQKSVYNALRVNTKLDKQVYGLILQEVLKYKSESKPLNLGEIEQILKKENVKEEMFFLLTNHKKGNIEKYIDSSFQSSTLNSEGKDKVLYREDIKGKLYKSTSLEKEIEDILFNKYQYEKLVKEIEKKKPKDFIILKSVIVKHFRDTFMDEKNGAYKFKDTSFKDTDKMIIKLIHEFIKGRYRKVKKYKYEDYEEIKKLFNENSSNKIVKRVESQINLNYINNNKYNLFLSEDQQIYKNTSVFKEIVKAEDTIRRKLATYVMDINLKYYAVDNNKDLLGSGTYKDAISELENCKKDIKSNITLDKDVNAYTKLYAAFELRNHVYHYQVLNKHKFGNQNEWESFRLQYGDDKIQEIVANLNENLKKDLIIKMTSNNIWLLDENSQKKLTDLRTSKFLVKDQFFPRFNKIYRKNIGYKIDNERYDFSEDESMILENYILNKFPEFKGLKIRHKEIIKQTLTYYYQTIYEYEFYDYVNSNIAIYKKMVEKLLKSNKIQKKDNKGKEYDVNNPKIEQFKNIIQNCFTLEEMNKSIQAYSKNNIKQLKNFLLVYNEVLAHLFIKFIEEKKYFVNLNYAFEYFTKSENGDKLSDDKDGKIEKVETLIENTDIELIAEEDIQKIKNSYFVWDMFALSEFLNIRNLNLLNNDLKKYMNFLESIQLKYEKIEEGLFDKVWMDIYNKLIGELEEKAVNFNIFKEGLEHLIKIQEVMIENVDGERVEKTEKMLNNKNNKDKILKFYPGISDIDKIGYEYRITSDDENTEDDEKFIKVIEAPQKEQRDDNAKEERIIALDLFIKDQEEGLVDFLQAKHITFIEKSGLDSYEDILEIYSAFRYKIDSNINVNKILEIKEIEKTFIESIINELEEKNDKHLEFIEYIQDSYREKYKKLLEIQVKKKSNNSNKYKKFKLDLMYKNSSSKIVEDKELKKLYEEVRNLKIIINNYNFIRNLVNLKSVKNAERILNNVQSRASDFYRTIERDSVYKESKKIEKIEFSKVEDIAKLNNEFKSLEKNRNYTVHKNFLQKKDSSNSVINEYIEANKYLTYSTKLNKSIFEVLKSQLEKNNLNIVFDYLSADKIKEIKVNSIERLDLYKGEELKSQIPLMSELEAKYIINLLWNKEKMNIVKVNHIDRKKSQVKKAEIIKETKKKIKDYREDISTSNPFASIFKK